MNYDDFQVEQPVRKQKVATKDLDPNIYKESWGRTCSEDHWKWNPRICAHAQILGFLFQWSSLSASSIFPYLFIHSWYSGRQLVEMAGLNLFSATRPRTFIIGVLGNIVSILLCLWIRFQRIIAKLYIWRVRITSNFVHQPSDHTVESSRVQEQCTHLFLSFEVSSSLWYFLQIQNHISPHMIYHLKSKEALHKIRLTH